MQLRIVVELFQLYLSISPCLFVVHCSKLTRLEAASCLQSFSLNPSPTKDLRRSNAPDLAGLCHEEDEEEKEEKEEEGVRR